MTAPKEISSLLDASVGSKAAELIDRLSSLVEEQEEEHYPQFINHIQVVNAVERELRLYVTGNGTVPYSLWLNSMSEKRTVDRRNKGILKSCPTIKVSEYHSL